MILIHECSNSYSCMRQLHDKSWHFWWNKKGNEGYAGQSSFPIVTLKFWDYTLRQDATLWSMVESNSGNHRVFKSQVWQIVITILFSGEPPSPGCPACVLRYFHSRAKCCRSVLQHTAWKTNSRLWWSINSNWWIHQRSHSFKSSPVDSNTMLQSVRSKPKFHRFLA